MTEMKADVLIVGGGTGGIAAALAATAMGKSVIITEETDWFGGQLSSQSVPPDENQWVDTVGATRRYRRYRTLVRSYYTQNYPVTPNAATDPNLNPGGGYVSRLCHEPRVSVAVLDQMLAPARAAGLIRTLMECAPVSAEVSGDRCTSVTVRLLREQREIAISARYILDATELGDLLPMAGVEYVSGAESQDQTGEMHAVAGDPRPDNVQALTWCFPLGYDARPGASHIIERPEQYERWRDFTPQLTPAWPGPLFSWVDVAPITLEKRHTVLFKPEEGPIDDISGLQRAKARFTYRRLINSELYTPGSIPFDVTLVNWPQTDYISGNLIDKDADTYRRFMHEAFQLSMSFIYWMQTDAPNYSTGSTGYPGLFLTPEVAGTSHGLAKMPYIRESRRIKALFTVTENHVGVQARAGAEGPELFNDSVGVGHYRIDLHMSTGGDNYIDVASYPFQIPLGALIPQRMENLLPACKNLGVTHITNGCYRLHPVEWNIGESAGFLAAYCLETNAKPRQVYENEQQLREFQRLLTSQGITLKWPKHALNAVRPE